MITIVDGSKDLLKLISMSIEWENLYKQSAFLIKEQIEDGLLICNTLTGEVILLTPDEADCLQNTKTTESIPADLIQHGILVPESCNELKRTEQLRSILQKRREAKKRITHYNILPTTDCNARCFYCYEAGIKHTYMTQETADMLLSYIADHYEPSSTLALSWYGGEPMLGRKWIDYICTKLNEMNIPFSSDMVSNGYLYDDALVEHAIDFWKLKGIQITLDGTEEIYNKVKAYVGIKGSAYKKVIQNISCFLDKGIHVDIRLNMDDHNYENLNLLINELEKQFLGKNNLIVYVRQLKENAGFNPIRHEADDLIRLQNIYLSLRKRLEDDGWPQKQNNGFPHLRVCSCMADNPNILQCSPDGILSKCEDSIYDHTVGNLKDGINNYKEIDRWKQRAYFEDCPACPLLPSCMHLLKNCPPRVSSCPTYEKEETQKKCIEMMNIAYNQWKSAQKND